MGRWPAEVARLAHQSGFIGEKSRIVLGGPKWCDDELDEVTSVVVRVFRLIAQLPARLALRTPSELAKAFGASNTECEVLLWSDAMPDTSSFGRADLIRTREGFRIVEINFGTTVAGMTLASLPHVFGLCQGDSPLAKWADFVASRTSSCAIGVLLENAPQGSPYWQFARQMVSELARVGHTRVRLRRPADLAWTGTELVDSAGVVDWVYPICFPEQILAERPLYSALEAAVRAHRVSMPIDLCNRLFGSKSALAMLHDLAQRGLLPPEDCALVQRHIPTTFILSSQTFEKAKSARARFVLKPSLRHGGEGVVVGAETSDSEWSKILDSVLSAGDVPHVVQEVCTALPEQTITATPSGSVLSCDSRYVWGFYFADGRACGTPYLRCMPMDATAVVSLGGGAAAGPLPHAP